GGQRPLGFLECGLSPVFLLGIAPPHPSPRRHEFLLRGLLFDLIVGRDALPRLLGLVFEAIFGGLEFDDGSLLLAVEDFVRLRFFAMNRLLEVRQPGGAFLTQVHKITEEAALVVDHGRIDHVCRGSCSFSRRPRGGAFPAPPRGWPLNIRNILFAHASGRERDGPWPAGSQRPVFPGAASDWPRNRGSRRSSNRLWFLPGAAATFLERRSAPWRWWSGAFFAPFACRFGFGGHGERGRAAGRRGQGHVGFQGPRHAIEHCQDLFQ